MFIFLHKHDTWMATIARRSRVDLRPMSRAPGDSSLLTLQAGHRARAPPHWDSRYPVAPRPPPLARPRSASRLFLPLAASAARGVSPGRPRVRRARDPGCPWVTTVRERESTGDLDHGRKPGRGWPAACSARMRTAESAWGSSPRRSSRYAMARSRRALTSA